MNGAWIARTAAYGWIVPVVAFTMACSRTEPPVAVSGAPMAELPAEYAPGKALFDSHCAGCHGQGAAGTKHGPSFLTKIYEPAHHGDASFVMAARRGVTAHHWSFGNMPPISDLSDDDLVKIIGYVRWVQRQAGIP